MTENMLSVFKFKCVVEGRRGGARTACREGGGSIPKGLLAGQTVSVQPVVVVVRTVL